MNEEERNQAYEGFAKTISDKKEYSTMTEATIIEEVKRLNRLAQKKLLQDFFAYVQTVPHDLRDDEIIDTFLDERNK